MSRAPVSFLRDDDELPFEDHETTPTELGDPFWDAFLPSDDELEPLPEPEDFWVEPDSDRYLQCPSEEPACHQY